MTREVLANSVLFQNHSDSFRRGLALADEIISEPVFTAQICSEQMEKDQKEMIELISLNMKNLRAIMPYMNELKIVFKWSDEAVAMFKSIYTLLEHGNYATVSTPTLEDRKYFGINRD